MKPLNNVNLYNLFRVYHMARAFIDLRYIPTKFAVDMIQRGEEYKKWYFEASDGTMGYNDEPVGPYKDHDDMYKMFRESNADNPVFQEIQDKMKEWEEQGLTITEYLNEDRYGCSYNVEGPEDLIKEFQTFDNGIFDLTQKWFERYDGDGDNPKVAASVS